MRRALAVLVLMIAAAPGVHAHPAGLPPFAEIRIVGDTARTTLSVQPDDTALLLNTAGSTKNLASDPFDEIALDVAGYVNRTYSLSIEGRECSSAVSGGRALERGTGYRIFIDHRCPTTIGDSLTIHNSFLRDLSEAYRLAVTIRKGSIKTSATLNEGTGELTFDLTRSSTEAVSDTAENATTGGLERLFSFLDAGSGIGAAIVAFGVAFLLGALHGLTPGHGKALVAAYLAGSDARARHAVAVGFSLTITHTFSVLALGVFALVAGTVIVPSRIEPVLKTVAAAMVIGVGVWMLVTRTRAYLKNDPTPAHHESGHHHHHPDDGHDHHHRVPNTKGIIALGLAGGIVPCPEAFGILFVALTLGRVGAGLFVLIGFSLGLAAVLVAVSLFLVASRKALAPRMAASPIARLLPIVSAIVVTALGVALVFAI